MIFINILRIGSQERLGQQSGPPSPGPGTYQSNSALAGPKYSMRPKTMQKSEVTPGPGRYEPKHSYDAAYNIAPSYS